MYDLCIIYKHVADIVTLRRISILLRNRYLTSKNNALLRNHSYIADIKYIEINLGKDEGREQKSQEPIQSLSKPKITTLTITPTPLNVVL